MSSTTAELAHLFRALKAPVAARSLPKLAERARAEEWSYERFAEALLSSEVASRRKRRGRRRERRAPRPGGHSSAAVCASLSRGYWAQNAALQSPRTAR
jgi:hypothetical protein